MINTIVLAGILVFAMMMSVCAFVSADETETTPFVVKPKDAVQDIELNLEDNAPADVISESEANQEGDIFDNFDENSLFDDFE